MLLKNGRGLLCGNKTEGLDLRMEGEIISELGQNLSPKNGEDTLDLAGQLILPAFIDAHVHLREPGLTHKETMVSGARSALVGGYSHIFAMPNVLPMPDHAEELLAQQKRAEACPINVSFYSPISLGEKGETLVDFKAQKEAGAIAFTDDGRGLQSAGLMALAMKETKKIKSLICAHCEEESLLFGGYIHEGDYARSHGHAGILSSVEDVQVARDLLLATELGAAYHICHMSSRKGVDLLALAKSWGGQVSGEVTPHHLILSQDDLQEHGNFKMNPPLRDEADRLALIQGVKNGTIQVIATDHAPHSPSEKSKGLAKSPFGIIGNENAFALLYTHLVKTNLLDLEVLVHCLTKGPAQVFGLDEGVLKVGAVANITVVDLEKESTIVAKELQSLSENTPFDGQKVFGMPELVFIKGALKVRGGKIIE